MGVMETIERLVALGPRWTGMEGDRRAPDLLAGELRELGRSVEVGEIRVRPAYYLAHALHMGLGAAGSVISAVSSPPLGLLLVLIATASMYADLTARLHLARLLTPRRSTRNVTSRGSRPDAPVRVVLTAHHDAGRTGLLYWTRRRAPRALRGPDARGRTRLSNLAGRVDLAFWTLVAALLAAVARLATGTDSAPMDVAQFVVTVGLMAYATLFVDVALSSISPGANDNASGVAAVLEVARSLEREPAGSIDVWVVFPAANHASMLGMRAWMDAHAAELDPRDTFFVNVDSVGAGAIHHVTGEGFALMHRHDPALIDLCERLGSRPRIWRVGTDGTLPTMRGFPSVTICCADERGRMRGLNRPDDGVAALDPGAVAAAAEFVEDLVREIDAVIGARTAQQTGGVGAADEPAE